MTTLLQRAIAAIESLPSQEQDAIAARLLAEFEDELAWDDRFRATSDEQWDRMAADARRSAAKGQVHPLDELFPTEGSVP